MMNWIQEYEYGDEAGAMLLCPVCAYSYQHHEEVREFIRIGGEDGLSAVGVPGIAGWVPNENNPSSRRGAVVVTFEGECGHVWALEIVQHKGETFLFARQDAHAAEQDRAAD